MAPVSPAAAQSAVTAETAQAARAAETDVDLELVLAVDTSGSVDDREYALQIKGIASAFRDPEVIDAIAAGPLGRIAVNVSFWAESQLPKQSLAWVVIANADDATAFAATLDSLPRATPAGGTGIGQGVIYSVRIMEDNALNGTRRVIDVSGDGRETPFRYFSVPPEQARAYAAVRGVTVNGLAILADEPDLERYYRDSVIVGPGAFTLAADDFEVFAEAIRRKLIREITFRPSVSYLPPEQSPVRSDLPRQIGPIQTRTPSRPGWVMARTASITAPGGDLPPPFRL